MNPLWLTAGSLLVLLALHDAVVTTLSTTSRAGPLTRALTVGAWRGVLALHSRRPSHRALSWVGPAMLLNGLLLWVLLLWAGWSLLLTGLPLAVIDSSSGAPVSGADRVYFVGMSLLSLGTGDVVGASATSRLLSVLIVGSGLFVLTLSLSYFVSVVDAATQRRVLARQLHALGDSPQDVLVDAWRGDHLSPQLAGSLTSLERSVAQLAERHVTYHVLHYFHAREVASAVVVGLARLDEALTLLERALDPSVRLDPLVTGRLRAHVGHVLEVVTRVHRTEPDREDPPAPETARLRACGIPVCEDGVLDGLRERRRQLAALVSSDGWSWEDVGRA